MRPKGLKAIVGYKKRRFKTGKPASTAPNLVARNFKVDAANKVWVTDITYLRCQSGWLYLCAVMDLYSRKIVGWSLQTRMTTDLALDALNQTIWKRNPEAGLILHSDQGSQFGSYDWVNFLKTHGIQPSMSRRGNCYDNAAKESFFRSLKTECVKGRVYTSIEEAHFELFEYIELFYNAIRLNPELSDSK
jgi:putative transposase